MSIFEVISVKWVMKNLRLGKIPQEREFRSSPQRLWHIRSMTCLGFINTFSDKQIWINKRTLQESGCWFLMGKPFLVTDSWWHLLLHETVSSFTQVIRQMIDGGEGHPQICQGVKPQVSAWSCYSIRVGAGLWGGEGKMKYSWGSSLGNWLSSTGTAY